MPIYNSLPAGAEGPVKVYSVADGDTFNLVGNDRRRVRVIGVDTPEIKTGAAFGQEAKAFTKALIEKKEVYLVHGAEERTDRYGRELCIVYVKSGSGSGYLCLNEELLQKGLAYFYNPNQQPFPNQAELLAAQNKARRNRTGLWASFEDYACVKTANGRAFHLPTCKSIENVKRRTTLKASEGFDDGLSPCRTCLNPDGNFASSPAGSTAPSSSPSHFTNAPPPSSHAAGGNAATKPNGDGHSASNNASSEPNDNGNSSPNNFVPQARPQIHPQQQKESEGCCVIM